MSAEVSACRLVASALGQQDDVSIEDSMTTLAAWDSLAHMNLILGIETELGRVLTAEELVAVVSVRDVAALLATG